MPVRRKSAEAHDTDRRWTGLGLYGHYGHLAFQLLRDEYLSSRDLVADRSGLPALRRSPEGLHVRVRPGTTGIPEHLYGCPITVEYVDLPSQADVEAAWGEVRRIVDRLLSEQPGCISMVLPGRVGLEAWAVPMAEELHRRFGDLVELTVGALRYPPSRQPRLQPGLAEAGRFPERLIPDDVAVELDGPAVVRSGHTLRHDLLVHNPTGRDVWVAFGERNAVVVDPRTGEVVGGYAGGFDLVLHILRVPAEQTGRLKLLIGTASFTPRLGYAVPPGEWGVQGLLRVVPETRGLDWSMFTPPPGSGDQRLRIPLPDMRGPDQRTPILPLTITA